MEHLVLKTSRNHWARANFGRAVPHLWFTHRRGCVLGPWGAPQTLPSATVCQLRWCSPIPRSSMNWVTHIRTRSGGPQVGGQQGQDSQAEGTQACADAKRGHDAQQKLFAIVNHAVTTDGITDLDQIAADNDLDPDLVALICPVVEADRRGVLPRVPQAVPRPMPQSQPCRPRSLSPVATPSVGSPWPADRPSFVWCGGTSSVSGR